MRLQNLAACFLLAAHSWAAVTWVPQSGGTPAALPASHASPVDYHVTCADAGTASLSDIQTAYNDSYRGDRILIYPRSATNNACAWTVNTDQSSQLSIAQVLLKKRPGTSGYVELTTPHHALLPPEGVRITPAYAPLMPTFTQTADVAAFEVAALLPPAEYVKFRGIRCLTGGTTQGSGAVWQQTAHSYGCINVGARHTGAYYPSGLVQTNLSNASSIGDDTFYVNSVEGLSPGVQIGIQDTTWSANEAGMDRILTIASVGTGCVTTATCFKTTTTATKAHISNARILLHLNSVGEAMLPNHIVISQIIGTQGGLHRQGAWLSLNGRTMTVQDSFLEGVMDTARLSDTQVVYSFNATGPLKMLNNYLSGSSENFMFGGQAPGHDNQLNYGLFVGNWFGHIPEIERLGPWSQTQEANRGLWNGSGPYGGRMVFAGRQVIPTNSTTFSTYGYFQAQNTGVVCASEPDWALATAVGVNVTETCSEPGFPAVVWKRMGATYHAMVKNNFELKAGKNVEISRNVFDWFSDQYPYNQQQPHMINFKASSYAETYGTSHVLLSPHGTGSPTAGCQSTVAGGAKSWPDCYLARTANILFERNLMRSIAGGFAVMGAQNYVAAEAGPYTIRKNLVLQFELPNNSAEQLYTLWSTSSSFAPSGGASSTAALQGPLKLDQNTFWASYFTSAISSVAGDPGKTGDFPAGSSVEGNIWFRGGAGGFRSSLGTDGQPIVVWPGTGQFKRNVIIGSPTGATYPSGYPAGEVFNNCATSSACPADWSYSDGTYGRLFRHWDRDKVFWNHGLLKVRLNHWAEGSMPNGDDVGADPDQVPEIRSMVATPTDRAVAITYTPTAAMAGNTGIWEIWTGSPNWVEATYTSFLADPATIAGRDRDVQLANGDRVVVFTGLSPSTTYYFRGHNYDVRRYQFTTLPTISSPVAKTVGKTAEHASTATIEIEYGTSYNAGTDTIDSPSTASVACAVNATCRISFTVPAGSINYYRLKEKASGGTTLLTGRVSLLP